jgi:hypothetical protein
MGKGCFLILIAATVSFLLIFPLQAISNHLNWPIFDGAAMHAGGWVIVWWLLFLIVYSLLFLIDRSWPRKSK